MSANEANTTYAPSRCNFIYVCQVEPDGTFLLGPQGWTVEHTNPGRYLITHKLGHKEYAVLPIAYGPYTSTIVMLDVDEESISISTQDQNVQADVAFTLTVLAVD